jgi:putative spermidine/putrescine transport system permease protein
MATSTAPTSPSLVRRISSALFPHPRVRLGLTLGPTLLWMIVIYLISLGVLLATSFWRLNELSSQVEHVWGLQNYRDILHTSLYRIVTVRTLGLAASVTVFDVALAFPVAYYAARMASPRLRPLLLLLVVMPLWANYLVKVFAWKTIVAGDGPADALFRAVGLNVKLGTSAWSVWLTLSYLWLPYVVLPIYAAFERIPSSYLEASSDLGARSALTFRRVVLPLVLPGVVAGSIFSFSLSLGDYITPGLVGKNIFLGNLIDSLVGTAGNRPLAAAIAVIPMVIMAIYLLIARAMGAFEAL